MPLLNDPDKRKKPLHPLPWWNERHLCVVFVATLLVTGYFNGWT